VVIVGLLLLLLLLLVDIVAMMMIAPHPKATRHLLDGIPFLSTGKLRLFHAAAAVKLLDNTAQLRVHLIGKY
jgi:hypothetical protein